MKILIIQYRQLRPFNERITIKTLQPKIRFNDWHLNDSNNKHLSQLRVHPSRYKTR